MKKVKAIVSGGKDLYGVWIEGAPIYSAGETLQKLKSNLQESIDLYEEAVGELPENMRGGYEIEYTFDITGALRYYSQFITYPALGKLSGINPKQLWNYANGYRRASSKTSEKIISSLHKFGNDLAQVRISL
ncbi:MAG: hypothetical protein LBL97_05450 [Prevotellaceae bacterium]|jgi:hypothetical protein|nr:hypothetical protein [Prevotellaceae bacterium]